VMNDGKIACLLQVCIARSCHNSRVVVVVYVPVCMSFLGDFAKLRKATISFLMSVCPSVRGEQLASRGPDFHEI
jgi:hypothetical protein